jgi:hypothetical protein
MASSTACSAFNLASSSILHGLPVWSYDEYEKPMTSVRRYIQERISYRLTATPTGHKSAVMPETFEQRSDVMSDFEDHPEVALGTILYAFKFSCCDILGLDYFLPEIKGPAVQTFLQWGDVNEMRCRGSIINEST